MKDKFIRVISLLLIVILMLSINLPVASASTMPFTDVPQDAWFHDAVAWGYDNEIVAGTSPTTFSPNDNVTRGQFVVFLHRLAGSQRVDDRIRFDDVTDPSRYYFYAVNWASDNGIVFGVDDGSNFMPSRNITRQEMAVIFFRFAKFQGRDTTAPDTALNRFSDMNNISNFAMEAMLWAANTGMLRGDSSARIHPRNFTTRAEIIVVIRRYVLNEPFTLSTTAAFAHHTEFNGVPIGGPATAHANDQQVWDFFISQGLNSYAVAGIMGNLFGESGMRSDRVQEGRRSIVIGMGMPTNLNGPQMDAWYTDAVNNGIITRDQFRNDTVGYGLSQWTNEPRKRTLYDYIMARSEDIGNLDDQLDFFWHELNTTEFATLRDLRNATCVLEASNTVLIRFMRPGNTGITQQGRRAGYALSYFNRFA